MDVKFASGVQVSSSSSPIESYFSFTGIPASAISCRSRKWNASAVRLVEPSMIIFGKARIYGSRLWEHSKSDERDARRTCRAGAGAESWNGEFVRTSIQMENSDGVMGKSPSDSKTQDGRVSCRSSPDVELRDDYEMKRWMPVEEESCSVMRVFSSMVMIIRELQTRAVQMRRSLPGDDRERIVVRVRAEIQDSLLWLFRHVFSPTPTMMVSLMVLVVKFTVDSIEASSAAERCASVCSLTNCVSPPSVSVEVDGAGEIDVGPTKDSDVTTEADDLSSTDLMYRIGIAEDRNNTLLLANYAQFLYVSVGDFDRAEEYFRKAVTVEPTDAEAYSKYANFLWLARGNHWAAEEAYLEAIAAEPSNSYYAANYAHFLWSTGGDDTCFPLDGAPRSSAS